VIGQLATSKRGPEPQPAAVRTRTSDPFEFAAVQRTANPAVLDLGFVEWIEPVWAITGVNHECACIGKRQGLHLSFDDSPNPSIRRRDAPPIAKEPRRE
jgi:hypothetical protein